MKKVRDNSAVPKGGTFIYVHEEGQPKEFTQKHPYFGQLKEMVRAYKLANNLPIGLQFDEEYEENICSHAHESTCEDFAPPGPFQKLANFAAAIGRATKSGFKTVSAELVQERFSICSACNFFGGKSGLLKIACKKCGCSGIKLHLASEHCPINRW